MDGELLHRLRLVRFLSRYRRRSSVEAEHGDTERSIVSAMITPGCLIEHGASQTKNRYCRISNCSDRRIKSLDDDVAAECHTASPIDDFNRLPLRPRPP